jgi:23S rRNA (adenine1618-N6)-methyltransferase
VKQDVTRRGLLTHDILPFPTEYHIPITENNRKEVAAAINDKLESLDLRWIWKEERMAGVGLAAQNVWSRSARRKKKRDEEMKKADIAEMDEGEDEEEDEKVALGFKIGVTEQGVQVRWLQGTDQVLYESFCGMLKRVVDGVA